MDESKPTGVAPGGHSGGSAGVAFGGRRLRGGSRRAKIRLAGLITGAVIVLALAGFGGFVLLYKNHTPGQTAGSNATGVKSSALTPQEHVQSYLIEKNYAAATAIYNSQLKDATTADQRAQANMGLCGVYTAEQDYQTAYQYALKAYGNEATMQTAQTAAGAAQNAGNNQDAAKYYQDAINLLQNAKLSPDVHDYTLRVLQTRLKEVS